MCRSIHWWLEIVNEAWVDDYDDARLNREYIKVSPRDSAIIPATLQVVKHL